VIRSCIRSLALTAANAPPMQSHSRLALQSDTHSTTADHDHPTTLVTLAAAAAAAALGLQPTLYAHTSTVGVSVFNVNAIYHT